VSAADLWARLSDEGLVEGELPERAQAPSPWYVRTMLGVAGWIGALFLLLFVGATLSVVMDEAGFAVAAGAACCAGAYALFRSFEGHDFADQFGLAVSLAGQMMMIGGLAQLIDVQDAGFFLAVAAVEAGLALAIPNFLHRVLAAAGAALALALAVNQLGLHGLAAPLLCAGLAFVWLEPERWAAGGRVWRPAGYGLVLALLLVETFRLFGAEMLFAPGTGDAGWMALYGPLLGRGLTAALLVWAAADIAVREGHEPWSRTSLAAAGSALVLGLPSLAAPGLASALLVLLLGFAAGNRLLLALGILALLGFITHFYYSLQASLLDKSILLAVTGLALLAAHFLLGRTFPPERPPEEADA